MDFKCEKCGRAADQLFPFRDHYTGEYYYACTVCEWPKLHAPAEMAGAALAQTAEMAKTEKGGERTMCPDELVAQPSRTWTPVLIPNDIYQAEVVDVKDMAFEDRNTWAISFKVTGGRPEAIGKIVDGLVTARLTERSKLWKWLLAMGIVPRIGTVVKKSDLIGRRCRILTGEKILGSGQTISTVKELLPL